MSVATRIRFSNALNCWNREILIGVRHTLAPNPRLDSPLGLGQGRVDADRGEVALLEEGVELGRASDRLDEDAHLVKLERVEQVVELAVLLLLLELEEVLLETVQRQLGLVVDVDLERLMSDGQLWTRGAELTLCMNFLQVARMSFDRVAENIMTCLWWGVALNTSWTSRRMSVG